MAYCIINDLYGNETKDAIAQLSNDTQPSKVDENVVNTIIAEQSDEIDSYVRGRYPLEKVATDPVLKKICIELTLFELRYRRNKSKITDSIQKSYDRQIQKLRDIQSGKMTLYIDDTDLRPKHMAVYSPPQIFTDELMEQYNG
jgi:phage gp36-like protein